jgi:predicted PhzF superfamily epimerase YddE/YHI9
MTQSQSLINSIFETRSQQSHVLRVFTWHLMVGEDAGTGVQHAPLVALNGSNPATPLIHPTTIRTYLYLDTASLHTIRF